jgi:hypothetical protein
MTALEGQAFRGFLYVLFTDAGFSIIEKKDIGVN